MKKRAMIRKAISMLLAAAFIVLIFFNTGLKAEAKTTASGIKIPSTAGWTSRKKIYIYSYDDFMKKRVDMILKKYPQFKPYVEYRSIGVTASSDDYLSCIDSQMDNRDSYYPSIVVAENSTVQYFAQSGKFMNLRKLGLTKKMTKNMYPYTLKQGSYNGKLVAVTGQTCPGVVFYNKKIAKKVFGTDNPTVIQKKLKNWSTFYETGKTLKKKGYSLVASADEVEEAFLYSKGKGWGKKSGKTYTFTVDASIKNYMNYSKKLANSGFTQNTLKWYTDWSDGFTNNKVFCYFGSPWMTQVVTMYGGKNGAWGVCQGPAKFNWGGDYLMAGKKTPNKELTRFMLAELTCETGFAVKFANAEGGVANNSVANVRLAKGAATKNNPIKKFFKSQNAYKIYVNAAKGMKSYLGYNDLAVLDCVKSVSNRYNDGDISSADVIPEVKSTVLYQIGWKSE